MVPAGRKAIELHRDLSKQIIGRPWGAPMRRIHGGNIAGIAGVLSGAAGIFIGVTATRSTCALDAASSTLCASWTQALGSIGAILVAIIVAAWQSHRTRLHAQLQFRPLLDVERITDQMTSEVKVILYNRGLGPAIFDDFELRVSGNVVRTKQQWIEAIAALADREFEMTHREMKPTAILAAGEQIELFVCAFETSPDPLSFEKLYEFPQAVDVRINYSTMFTEEVTFISVGGD